MGAPNDIQKVIQALGVGFYPTQLKWLWDSSPSIIIEKARKTGLSWTVARRAVRRVIGMERRPDGSIFAGKPHKFYYLSANEDRAKEWMDEMVSPVVLGIDEALKRSDAGIYFFKKPNKDVKTERVEFTGLPGKLKIVAMTANPDTSRGPDGDTVFDEFAFVRAPEKLYDAGMGITTMGHALIVNSTHDGPNTLFAELCERKRNDPDWSWYRHTIEDARREGMYTAEQVRQIRARCRSEAHFQQDYMCEPIRAGACVFDRGALDEAYKRTKDPIEEYWRRAA